MGAGLDPRERLSPALVDDEGANGVGFARIFRAVLAPRPRRADAADEIERGVELCRQFDRDFAIADAEGVVVHGMVLAVERKGVATKMAARFKSGNDDGRNGCPPGLAIAA